MSDHIVNQNIAENLNSAGAPAGGIPHAAAVLAYAGALPAILGAMLVVFRPGDYGPIASDLLVVYGTMLIAFFGGVRWGVAVMGRGGPTFRSLLGAVAPLVLAGPLMLMDAPRAQLALIAVALPLLLLDDLRATKRGSGAPDWYLGVRAPLTLMLVVAFGLALAGLTFG